jgi:hypothetical protein
MVSGPEGLPAVSDLDDVPVRIVHRISQFGFIGDLADVVLGTMRVDPDGHLEHVVAARLRFNLKVAKDLRRCLDEQIACLTQPGRLTKEADDDPSDKTS